MFAAVYLGLFLLFVVSGAQSTPSAQKQTLGAFLLQMNDAVQRDLVEAAELMPAEHYGFTATNQTRPFGHTVAHIALSRFGSCSGLLGRDNPRQGQREDTPRTKAETVALLKEAGALCSEAQKGLTDDSLLEFISIAGTKVAVQKPLSLSLSEGESPQHFEGTAICSQPRSVRSRPMAFTGCVVGATDCKVARTDSKSGDNAS